MTDTNKKGAIRDADADDAGRAVENGCIPLVPRKVPDGISESDERRFWSVVTEELSDEQKARIAAPARTFPRQKAVLAVHWHPEHVPMDLIRKRIDATFPGRKTELIIPTQHNELMAYGDYTGVEVDCYSLGFNQKVQLLLHFESERAAEAAVLKEMLAHTFKYRSSQLFDFIRTLTDPVKERLDRAARETGANPALVDFVRAYAGKIADLLDRHADRIPARSIKNKVLRNFFDTLRPDYGDALIDRSQTFLTAVKKIVKAHFPPQYFYRTSEVIEEARSLGAGIVIPHPEQFWPVLLADYDVDGIEVWNPQSRQYTQFLISVLKDKNQRRAGARPPLLIFMGDDTHMAEKTRNPADQKPGKANREIGLQPAWDDLTIRKTLIMAKSGRRQAIAAYKERLAGR
jgi:hypothetical protein